MGDLYSQAIQQELVAQVAAELRVDGVEEIGRGGFGVVFRCAQSQLDGSVAVKVLTTELDPENLARFMAEQRAMGRLSGHPHIVTVLQVGTTLGGRPFIVMPYRGKGSLWSLISRNGPLDWLEVISIGVKLAGALEAAHHAGILHRDVQPGNVLLTDCGEPQLTDFGLSGMAGGFETRAEAIIGSPTFVAPEVLEGAGPTTASDVYSLGATLFFALTGEPSYGRSVPDVVRERGLPDEVCAVVECAMIRDPAERPATAVECGEQLRDLQRRLRVATHDMVLPADLKAERGSSAASGSPNRRDTTLAPPAPATKCRPPVAVRSLVTRQKLMAVLRAAGRRRLILIHAPSGFGKTTLVEQWRAELTSSGVAVAWLTVDDDDNNVVWFVAHVLEAIRRVHPAVAALLGQVLEERGEVAVRYVLTSLIDEVDENGTPVTLVIDDWQRVSHSQTTDALRFLIDHGSHHLQIIVNSWSRARLPLSKLRLRDELVEIDCEKLRFDADEAQSLLNDIAGLQLAASDVAALTASTDGWVAALQLARLSLRGDGLGSGAAGLLRRMSGDNDVAGEFLAENVLDTLEPELLEFLWATSITERTCGELASLLAGVSGGQDVLEDVERRGLFLRRIDDDPRWFRYHQMFAGFLRRRLERDSPDRLKHLHRTASDWFADHGYLSYAVDHALAAGEATRAVDLVEQDRTTGLVNQSRMTAFLGIIEKLPPQLVNSRPRLHLSVAAANILLQRPAATEAALDRVTGAISRADLPEATRADLTLEAKVLRAVAQMNADRVEGLAHLVAEVISRPKTLRPVLPQATATVAAFVGIYRFDFEAAHRALEWAAPYDERVAAGYHSCWAGIAARYQLDIPRALRSFRKAFEIGTAVGRESQAARHAGALLGELLYETGEFAEAADLLEESYRLGPEAGAVDYLSAQYAVSARIKAPRGIAMRRPVALTTV